MLNLSKSAVLVKPMRTSTHVGSRSFTTGNILFRLQTFENTKPTTAYQCFVKDYFATHKDKNLSFDKKDARKSWFEASQEIRESYKKVLAKEKRNHEALKNILGVNEIPAKPKSPGGPFAIFVKEKSIEETDVKGPQKIVSLAEAWKKLSNSGKKPYKTKYEKAVKNYKEELAEYNSKYVINIPKPPPSANALYIKDAYQTFKDDNPSLSGAELFTKISKSWANLSEREKGTYQKQAQKQTEKYLKEKLEYQKKTGTYSELSRPPSSFGLYFKENSGKLEGKSRQDSLRSIAKDWKELSPAKKAVYKEKSVKLWDEYKDLKAAQET